MRQSWETMASVSAGHIIVTPTQPVGSGRPQRESNPGPPLQESRALPQSYRAPELFATPPRPSIKQQNTETSTAVISRFTADIPSKLKLRNSVNLQKINIPELLKKTFDDKADKPEEKLQILNLKI